MPPPQVQEEFTASPLSANPMVGGQRETKSTGALRAEAREACRPQARRCVGRTSPLPGSLTFTSGLRQP